MMHTSLSRRTLLGGLAACLPWFGKAAAQADAGELLDEPWLLRSFLDLREDFANAAKAGRNFVIVWEMRGCPYCKLLHGSFKEPRISAYIQANFDVLQLDLLGSREVTDFDGEKIPEKLLARKYGIRSTPALQFFSASLVHIPQEIGRVGYIKADDFYMMLRFVRERGYEKGPFDEWMKTAR